MKEPRNDDELKKILKKCGRTDKEVEGIIDFSKLTKSLQNDSNIDFEKVASELKKKYNED